MIIWNLQVGQSYHAILRYVPSNHSKLTLKANNIRNHKEKRVSTACSKWSVDKLLKSLPATCQFKSSHNFRLLNGLTPNTCNLQTCFFTFCFEDYLDSDQFCCIQNIAEPLVNSNFSLTALIYVITSLMKPKWTSSWARCRDVSISETRHVSCRFILSSMRSKIVIWKKHSCYFPIIAE